MPFVQDYITGTGMEMTNVGQSSSTKPQQRAINREIYLECTVSGTSNYNNFILNVYLSIESTTKVTIIISIK